MRNNKQLLRFVEGDEKRLDRFAKDVKRVCGLKGIPTKSEIEITDAIFSGCFTRVYVMKFEDERTCFTVKINLKELRIKNPDDDLAIKVLYLFKFYARDPHFDLDIDRHQKLIDDCSINETTFNVEKILLSNDMSCWHEKEAAFESIQEFMVFVAHHKGVSIKWTKNDEPNNLFKVAQMLLDGEMYICAINRLMKIFDYNPLALSARFELVNAYIALSSNSFMRKNTKDLQLAKTLLLDMHTYIKNPVLIALFYRRLGYIFVDEGKPDLGLTCNVYSLKYDESENALGEIEYIKNQFNLNISEKESEKLLSDNGVPIISM